jgi:hypothetical protein
MNLVIIDEDKTFWKDEFEFVPYRINGTQNGYYSFIDTSQGGMLIRYGGSCHAYSCGNQVYEVIYPGESESFGYQTVDMIWDYLLMIANANPELQCNIHTT